MKNTTILATIALAALLTAAFYFVPSREVPRPAKQVVKETPNSDIKNTNSTVSLLANEENLSPFGTYREETPAEAKRRVDRRREKMKRLNFETPEKYYEMNLAELRELAEKGDVPALLQLGEQYASEAAALARDPVFDGKEFDHRKLAEKYFTSALANGYTAGAAVFARKYAEEGYLVDAYAWQLLAERFNDKSNAGVASLNSTFARLSQKERDAANRKFVTLFHTVNGQAIAKN